MNSKRCNFNLKQKSFFCFLLILAVTSSIILSPMYISDNIDLVTKEKGSNKPHIDPSQLHSEVWTTTQQLTTNVSEDQYPAIFVNESGHIWAVWESDRSGRSELWLTKSKDGGDSWDTPTQLTDSVFDTSYALKPTIIGDAQGTLWICWVNQTQSVPPYFALYVMNSTDGGLTWNRAKRPLTGNSHEYDPCLRVDGNGVLWLTYVDRQLPSDTHTIYILNSTDGGNSWSSKTQVYSIIDSYRNLNMLMDSPSNITILWSNDSVIFRCNSTSGGNTWGDPTVLINSTNTALYPCTDPSLSQDRSGIYWLIFQNQTQISYCNTSNLQDEFTSPCILSLNLTNNHQPYVFGDPTGVLWVFLQSNNKTSNEEIYYTTLIELDRSAPIIHLISLSPNPTVEVIFFTANATEPLDAFGLRANITTPTTTFPNISLQPQGNTWHGTFNANESGVHTIIIFGADISGNLGSIQSEFTVDNSPPMYQDLTYPRNVTVGSNFTIALEAWEPPWASGVDNITLHVRVDGGNWTLYSLEESSSQYYTSQEISVEDGQIIEFYLIIYDTLGNSISVKEDGGYFEITIKASPTSPDGNILLIAGVIAVIFAVIIIVFTFWYRRLKSG